MPRSEFPMRVIRAARHRANGKCEAVGANYGLPVGQRCDADLRKGVEFDHIIPDQLGGEATLDNCAAVCPRCHRHKTSKIDVPRISEAKRREDANLGIRRPSPRPMPGSKASGIKRTFDGRVIDRSTGLEK